MTAESERDDFFRYATFAVAGITAAVLLCFVFLFIAPQRNPILALRPVPPTSEQAAFQLPPTWTPSPTMTYTPSLTDTPTRTSTSTNTVTPRPTNTPLPTATPSTSSGQALPPTATPMPTALPPNSVAPTRVATSRAPTPTPRLFVPLPTATPRPGASTPVPPTRTGVPPSRTPLDRPLSTPSRTPMPRTATPRPPTKTPTPQYDFVLGRPPEKAPNCGTWYLSGTVYNNQSGSQRLNGVLVRVYDASGQVLGTIVTGTDAYRPGYWEYIFPHGSAVRGDVAIVRPDGSLRSPRKSYRLTADCAGSDAVNQIVFDFVGTH